eukprot:2808108-Pyramimonas_sp.AAC.1
MSEQAEDLTPGGRAPVCHEKQREANSPHSGCTDPDAATASLESDPRDGLQVLWPHRALALQAHLLQFVDDGATVGHTAVAVAADDAHVVNVHGRLSGGGVNLEGGALVLDQRPVSMPDRSAVVSSSSGKSKGSTTTPWAGPAGEGAETGLGQVHVDPRPISQLSERAQ